MVSLCVLLYRASLPLERVCVQGVPFPALVDTKSDTISVKSKPGNRSIASPTPSVPKLPHDVDLRYFDFRRKPYCAHVKYFKALSIF